MSILDINKKFRKVIIYVAVSVFCILFTFIYNKFSHEVYSFYMNFLFLWPLLGGLWYLLCGVMKVHTNTLTNSLMGAGVATITAGSMVKGILEIAGTTSIFEKYFFIVGVALVFIATCYTIYKKFNEV